MRKDSLARLEQHGVSDVPVGWRQTRVKYLGKYMNGYPFKPNDWGSEGRPILRIQDLSGSNPEPNRFDGDIPSRYLVRRGDILISWSASLGVYRWDGEESWLNQHIFKVEVNTAQLREDFFVWLAEWFISEMDREVHGSTMQHLTADAFGGFPVLLPPDSEQRRIARYLDRETAQIDALIVAKERVLELLAEKRRALITRAVTCGLDPNARLRDSRIPWLGEIPAHWETKRAKWLFSERDQRSVTGEEVLLSLRMERGLVPHNEVSDKPTRPEELVGYKRASSGEIVVNRMRASIGLVALSREDGLVSPDYAVFVPSRGTSAEYYVHLFTTELLGAVFRSVSTGMGTGSSGFLRLYSESFLSLWLPYPPFDEQSAIVEFVGRESGRLDEMRGATERTIALLKERRSALVAAAVTGQLDVGGPA